MNKLRLYLILAILFVGLIPDPNKLLDSPDCNSYDSFFINVHWNWRSCAIAPQDAVFLRIPGYLSRTNPIARETLPAILVFIVPSWDWSTWGGIYPPRMWNEKEKWKLVHLKYQILPKLEFRWSE